MPPSQPTPGHCTFKAISHSEALDLAEDADPARQEVRPEDAYGDQAVAGTGSYTYDAQGRLTLVTPATGTGQQL